MKKWERRARMAIRATIARYTWCGDFGDTEGFVGCFTEDAVLSIKGGQRWEGHEGLARLGGGRARSQASAARLAAGPIRHHVSSVRIELESKALGHAWSYFLTLGRHGLDHWGRYADELVSAGDEWLLRRRRVSIDGASEASVMFPDGPPLG